MIQECSWFLLGMNETKRIFADKVQYHDRHKSCCVGRILLRTKQKLMFFFLKKSFQLLSFSRGPFFLSSPLRHPKKDNNKFE